MLIKSLRQLARNRRGATAIEYGLIVGLIAITMIVAFMTLASTTVGMWNNVSTKVQQAG
jgi:pilus assembly protein Flp/PilA